MFLLRGDFDTDAVLPCAISYYEKRSRILTWLQEAEADGNNEIAQFMKWELAFLDLIVVPAEEVSPYRGGTYDDYAAFIRRAEFHRATGNGMLTAMFFREARSLAE